MNDDRDWHTLPSGEVLDALHGSTAGLSQEEVDRRLARHGANTLPQPPRRHPLLHLLSQFHNVLIYVLLGAAVWAFFWAVGSGQFDDLDSPACRILGDDDDRPRR